MRSRRPGDRTHATVVRAQSGNVSVSTATSSGLSTVWDMAAAIRSPLALVRWISRAPSSVSRCSSACSGSRSTAATRGSALVGGSSSFATRPDWTTTRTSSSTGSTS